MSESTDFGTFGRFEETPVGDMPADMKEAYDFTIKLRGLVPGPHRIWLANSELSKTVVPIGAYYQTRSTLTKPEIEIATNLVNGRWLAAYSNYEHEIIGEGAGGLPPEKVETIIAGRPTAFDDPRQQVVYELASALVAPRVVPKGLYRRAKALLGGCRHRRCDDAARVVHRRVADPCGLRCSLGRHRPEAVGLRHATWQPRRSPSASRSGEKVRQVVILTVGAVWRADYELYAHSAVARIAGLPESTIGSLANGGPPEGLSDAERIAQRFGRQLTAERHVEEPLYQNAEAAFGREIAVAMTFLAGCYQVVCSFLNAF